MTRNDFLRLTRTSFGVLSCAALLATPVAIRAQEAPTPAPADEPAKSDGAEATPAAPAAPSGDPGESDLQKPVDPFDYESDTVDEGPKTYLLSKRRPILDDVFEINAFGPDRQKLGQAITAALDEASRIERLMSAYVDGTEIAQVNAAAGSRPVKVSAETMEMVIKGIKFSQETGGAYDISYAALRGLWKFDVEERKEVPPKAEIEARLKLIDFKKISFNRKDSTVYLPTPGMRIDVGGLAKGYALDQMKAILRKAGVEDFQIRAGNSMMVEGRERKNGASFADHKSDQSWEYKIPDPRENVKNPFPRLPLRNQSVFTSWDADRFFILNKQRYHHIIDPKKGYPATQCRSVTLIADNAAEADALATAVFIMGPQKGMEAIAKIKNMEAIIIDAQEKVHITPHLEKLIAKLKAGEKGIDLKSVQEGGSAGGAAAPKGGKKK